MTTHASTATPAPLAADSADRPKPDFQTLARMIAVGSGPREQIAVVSPIDGTPLGSIPLCTAEDVEAAMRRARTAQTKWAALPLRERTRIFIKAHDMFLDARHALADIIQLENGKTRLHAFEEAFDVALNLRFYSYHAKNFIGPKRVRGAVPPFTRTVEVRRPWGVVGLIEPWNYPLNLAVGDAIPAMIAGNTVVIKPSELTPFSLLAGFDILRRAGLPDDVMQIVSGDGATTGSALVERADYIMFTGSTAVGRKIAEQCGRRLIPYSMELGGKNPAVVLEDADLDKSLDCIVDGTLVGSGQTCVSFERLYVDDAVYDQFVPRLAERLKNAKLGASLNDLNDNIGTLTSAAQLAKVKAHVDDAVAKGAHVLAGGTARPDLGPYFFAPTLLENVTPEMKLHKDETFGPVLSVYRVKSADEAVAACNDSAYGLHASVFGRNIARAEGIGQRIEAGTISINDNHKAAWASMHTTQGGFKQSGAGRRHGREGITKYTQIQNVSTQRVLTIAPSKLLPPKRWEWFFDKVLRLMRRVPGLR